ncbi:calcineurin-like metallo-phosphoesterase super family protein [Striga asiatica]|uniref:Calcineurin-like metallo-phosphoesterase super family protein n=1 Tax=Striga asiatica TaxID=4170 RepID=A0A5A7PDJ3_STRAF|nr:calcineurin-like metallo-phosphoesterase super family protein [Striga asiatica]
MYVQSFCEENGSLGPNSGSQSVEKNTNVDRDQPVGTEGSKEAVNPPQFDNPSETEAKRWRQLALLGPIMVAQVLTVCAHTSTSGWAGMAGTLWKDGKLLGLQPRSFQVLRKKFGSEQSDGSSSGLAKLACEEQSVYDPAQPDWTTPRIAVTTSFNVKLNSFSIYTLTKK